MTRTDEMQRWLDVVENKGACCEALLWLHTQPSPEAAWANCHRADWMLWLIWEICVRDGTLDESLARACSDECLKHQAALTHRAEGAASHAQQMRECADIVRKHFPTCPLKG